jgi:hypothetical protein
MLLVVALPFAVAHAQEEHAAHAHAAAMPPPPAHRWAADADLRDGMGRIHAALEQLRGFESGRIDAAAAAAQVARIEQAAADIFAKCKLPVDQDAVLHRMLAPLLAAAQRLKSAPADVAQVEAMRVAVADYPRYFDAPTWQTPAVHAH